MAVRIEDFIGKVGNLDGDVTAYELAKTKELYPNGGTQKYSASSDEIVKFVSKYRPGKETTTGLTSGQTLLNKGVDVTRALGDTQKTQSSQYNQNEMFRISNMLDIINKKGQVTGGLMGMASRLVEEVGGGIALQLQQEAQLRTDINEKVGMQGELSKGLREEIIDAYPSTLRLGYGITQLTDMMTNMMSESGRFNLISKETIGQAAATARSFVGDLSEMGRVFGQFEKVGLGASDATKAIDKAGKSSLSLGLNSKKTTQDLRDNLGKLNEFGFANGVQGLNRMVQKANEFRMSMDSVYQIADKVFSPEGALELSANLSVLGGAMGDFGDPIKLMYMATNNVEGLQDALIGAAGSLTTYNQEQGRFEITGVNLRKAKAMASELGISYQELAKGAIAASERTAAASALMTSGLVMEDKEREFLTNLSQMKDGKMVIEVPKSLMSELGGQTEVILEDLTNAQKTTLLANQEAFEKMSTEDIARGQLSAMENIERDIGFMAATTRGRVVNMAKSAAEAAGLTGEDAQKFVKETADNVSKGTVQMSDNFNKLVGNYISELKGEKPKSQGTATTQTNAMNVAEAEKKAAEAKQAAANTSSTTVVKHEVSVKSSEALMDGWSRQIVRDASIKDDFISTGNDEYTTPPKTK
jgi:hypothetical protein